jgi:hypothetical protein
MRLAQHAHPGFELDAQRGLAEQGPAPGRRREDGAHGGGRRHADAGAHATVLAERRGVGASGRRVDQHWDGAARTLQAEVATQERRRSA